MKRYQAIIMQMRYLP